MTSPRSKPKSRFVIERGKSGVDETYVVVDVETGHAIAMLPFWYEAAATKRDAKLLVRALDRFRSRGGYLFPKEFVIAVDVACTSELEPQLDELLATLP